MQLIQSPNSFLTRKVKPFDFNELDAKQVSGEMCQIMMAKNGLGLAANQVELDAQIFVMRPVENEAVTKPFAVINPVIMKVDSDTVLGKEGCLSLPDIDAKITRNETTLLQYTSEKGEQKKLIAEWPLSGGLQHECDHLEGKLFIHRMEKKKAAFLLDRWRRKKRKERIRAKRAKKAAARR